MLKPYMRLIRIGPFFTLYLLVFFLGVACANAWHSNIIFAGVSIFLFSCAGHAINYIADVKVDALAAKVKDVPPWLNPVLTGEISKKQAYAFSLITSCISLLFASFAGPFFFLLFTLSGIGCIVCYSLFYFKSKPGWDMIFPLSTLCLFPAGYYLVNLQLAFPVFHLCAFAPAVIAAFLDTAIHDIDSDRRADLRTTAVFLGEKNSRRVETTLIVLTSTISVISLLLTGHSFFLLMLSLIPIRLLNKMKHRVYAFTVLSSSYILLTFLYWAL